MEAACEEKLIIYIKPLNTSEAFFNRYYYLRMNCQKSLFSIDPEVTYLNCAYFSPQLNSAEEIGINAVKQKGTPYPLPSNVFFDDSDRLRKAFGKLINTDSYDRIVSVPSVSYGIANVVKNSGVQAGDRIVLIGDQFPSNMYSWVSLAKDVGAHIHIVDAPTSFEQRGKEWNNRILEAIDSSTRVVSMAHVHWTDGTVFDLQAIRKRTREIDALLIVDGTQSVGAFPFDIQEIQPDALVCSGYKWLLGQYNLGVAYYGPAFDQGTPIEESWINRIDSEDFANLVDYKYEYRPAARRFEVGEHGHFIQTPILINSIEKLVEWGVENIQEYCHNLVEEPMQVLREHGYVIGEDPYQAYHLFGIRVTEKHDKDAIKHRLADEKVVISFRGDCIRVSPHVYNSKEDIMKLVEVLTA